MNEGISGQSIDCTRHLLYDTQGRLTTTALHLLGERQRFMNKCQADITASPKPLQACNKMETKCCRGKMVILDGS